MDTQNNGKSRRHFTSKRRQRLLAKFHQSRLTQNEFAAQHNIGLSSLSRWLRLERDAVPPKVKFQEVRLPNPASRWPVEVVSPQGWIVRLQNGSDVQIYFGNQPYATNGYVYDPTLNLMTSSTDPLGHTNGFMYDAYGNVLVSWDAFGNPTSNDVDPNTGNLLAITDALNETTVNTYNGSLLVASSDPLDNTSTNVYDNVGNLIASAQLDASGTLLSSNSYTYDDNGNRLTSTVWRFSGSSPIGSVTTYVYDGQNRVIQTINPDGGTNSVLYDANQTTFTDSLNRTTTTVYDVLNRAIQIQYPDNTTTGTDFDADGRKVATTNQDSVVTQFGYDGAGRLVSVTDALNQTTRYQYDMAGNQIAQIDALNRTNTYAYDGMGRRISHALPGSQTEMFAYDLDGNMVQHANFNGTVVTNQYDALNRLTNRGSVFGYRTTFGYSPTGQRINMIDASGSTAYFYDVRDRLTNKVENFVGELSVALYYEYDVNGNVTNIVDNTFKGAGGVGLAYAYDSLNRLTNVADADNTTASYSFDPVGNLQIMQYGSQYGIVITNLYQYDMLNRLTNLVSVAVGGTNANFYYQLGLTGNRTNLSESVNGTSRNYQWQYDRLYRLTNETISALGTLGYGYDQVGNRTMRTSTGGLLSAQTLSYNTNDWLSGDGYDSNGNTTNSGDNTYQYDALNELTNVSGSAAVICVYDGDGNRVMKVVGGITNYYLVDDRNPSGYAQVLEELLATGPNGTYDYGLNLITQNKGGATYDVISDGHGSTRILADNYDGGVFFAFAYDAYGNLVVSNNPPPTAYLYCGQQFDPDLGMYYNRARYLNTGTGRFWTIDSYEGNNEDPLSLHKYLYAEDNPVMGTDPSGNDLADVTLAAGLGAGIDALADTAIVGAEVSAETTVEATEVAEVTETAVAEGESTAAAEEEAAETTLEEEGTSVRKLIEQAKKLKNLAKDVKVIPMPQAVIPAICANITAYQAQNPLTGFELTRCGKLQRDRNRTAAEAAYLANPIRGLPSVSQNFDEYPFASSFQGGKGARVTPVPIWQNSLQGGIVSGAYKIEKIKEDTAYTVVVIP